MMSPQPMCMQRQLHLQQLTLVFVALLFSWTYSRIFMMTLVGAITTQSQYLTTLFLSVPARNYELAILASRSKTSAKN